MSKLWIFGDSFAIEPNKHYNYRNKSDWIWPKQLLRKMSDIDKIEIIGIAGCSNEYIMKLITDARPDFAPGDYLIVITTSIMRQWIFPDCPELGNIHSLINFYYMEAEQTKNYDQRPWYIPFFPITTTLDKRITKKQKKALESYYTELFLLNSEERGKIFLETFMTWAYSLGNWHNLKSVVILPAFNSQPLHTSSNGMLLEIDAAEFKKKGVLSMESSQLDRREKFIHKNDGVDPRIMHLSRPNHSVLADKLYNFFVNQTDIDLSSGFHESLFDDKFENWRLPKEDYQIAEDKI